jgi:hypothetical protein
MNPAMRNKGYGSELKGKAFDLASPGRAKARPSPKTAIGFLTRVRFSEMTVVLLLGKIGGHHINFLNSRAVSISMVSPDSPAGRRPEIELF